jgi:hypothetical protein
MLCLVESNSERSAMSNYAEPTQSPREHVVEVLAMTLLDMLILGKAPHSATPTLEPDDAAALQQPDRGQR